MALNKTAVFIASRFGEFVELREALRHRINDYRRLHLSAIDLNDSSVASRPPLAVCLGNVRACEFMILLLGETYGGLAPGRDKSFTHLEYLEAAREDSETRVLAFGVGPSYAGNRLQLSADPALAAMQAEVEANHTMGYFDGSQSVEDLADAIFEHLLAAFYELHFDQIFSEDDEDAEYALDGGLENTEVESLEALHRRLQGKDLDPGKPGDLLARPAWAAAREQCEEAHEAMKVGAHAVAMSHFRRALELRPLDTEANYWLARLYLATGRRRYLRDSLRMLERCARSEARSGNLFRTSDCYQLLARAALTANETEQAEEFARQAKDAAPGFGRAWYELGRVQAVAGNMRAAQESLREAFGRFFPLIFEARRDPALRPLHGWVNARRKKLIDHEVRRVQAMHEREQALAEIAGTPPAELPEATSVRSRRDSAQLLGASLQRQRAMIGRLLQARDEAHHHATVQPPQPSPLQAFQWRPDRAEVFVVEAWLKKPGDVIARGEPLCRVLMGVSASRYTVRWPRESARIHRMRVQEGVKVESGASPLIDCSPPDWKPVAASRASELEAKRQDAALKSGFMEQELAGAAKRRRKQLVGGTLAIAAALGLAWLSLDMAGLALIIGIIGLVFVLTALRAPSQRNAFADQLCELEAQLRALGMRAETASAEFAKAWSLWLESLSQARAARAFQRLELARTGDLVLASVADIEAFQARGMAMSTRWLEEPAKTERGSRRLLRVLAWTGASIQLCESASYEDASE